MNRLFVVGSLLVPSVASAHIHLTHPLSRTDDTTGNPQKDQHCGTVTWDREANASRVQTFLPGETITVTWTETIDHPGWFRIAFQPNGEIFGIPPVGAGGAGAFPDQPQVGVDPVNGSIVLVDRIPDGTTSQQITFPDMLCDNCTLQLIQVMTDKAPYTTDAASDDIYFNCSDIVLSGFADDAGPNAGTDAGPTAGPDAGSGGNAEVPGGCSTGAGSSGLVLALALVGLRRRRPR